MRRFKPGEQTIREESETPRLAEKRLEDAGAELPPRRNRTGVIPSAAPSEPAKGAAAIQGLP